MLAPQDARGDMHGAIREPSAKTKERAIPVDHGGDGAGLRPRGAVLSKIASRKSTGATGAEKRSDADLKVIGREESFGQPRELKEKHVPTSAELPKARTEKLAHHGGVGDIDDHELGDALRVEDCRAPCHGGAPIVTREEDFLLTELIRNSNDVRNQFGERIGADLRRFAAEVIPALIGHDDAKPGSGQWFDLLLPPIPEFGEAVEENYNRAIRGAGHDGMQAYVRVLEEYGFQEIVPAEQFALSKQETVG